MLQLVVWVLSWRLSFGFVVVLLGDGFSDEGIARKARSCASYRRLMLGVYWSVGGV
jgi:hypothetical protein